MSLCLCEEAKTSYILYKCTKCKQDLPAANFYASSKGRKGLRSWCRDCENKSGRAYSKANLSKILDWRHRTGRSRPLALATDSSSWLGYYIAERALSRFFDTIIRMRYGNPGFDFLCGKGYKIDVKSSCLQRGKKNRNPYWSFHTNQNQITDYFLCLGFDDRISLTPLHVWLIPRTAVGHLITLSITNTSTSLARCAKYEQQLDRVVTCCNKIREQTVIS